jgi:hypothetical protein
VILAAIGVQRSPEFAYFLISLLKEEYGISHDILPAIALLPATSCGKSIISS